MKKELLILLSLSIIFATILIIFHLHSVSPVQVSFNTTVTPLQHLWLGTRSISRTIYAPNQNSTYFIGYGGVGQGGDSLFGMYNKTSGTFEDLSMTDIGNWIGQSSLYAITYDTNNSLVYIGGENGVFAAYNRTSNTTTDLRGADPGDWIGTNSSSGITSLTYSTSDGLVYLTGFIDGFAVYNRTSGVTNTLGLTDDTNGNFFHGWPINNAVYAPSNNLIYIVGQNYVFGSYNRTTNITTDMTNTETANWLAVTGSTLLYDAYDPDSNLIYIVGKNTNPPYSVFGVYNITSNITTNLNATDTAAWIDAIDGPSGISDLGYDNDSKLLYLGGTSIFGVYNKTSNVTTDLTATDPLDWLGTNAVNGLSYDSSSKILWMGGSGGVFGDYNRTSNVAEDLNLPNDWVRYKFILNSVYSPTDNLLYLVGQNGIFGDYNLSSNSKEDLRATDAGDWIGRINSLNGIAYDNNHSLVYVVGEGATFGFYNRTTNTTQSLNGTATPNWIQFNTLNTLNRLAYNSKDQLMYFTGYSSIFGYYNLSSNTSTNLNQTDIANWIGNNAILYGMAYDSKDNLMYLTGQSFDFGVYNRTDNKTYSLKSKDTGDWIGSGGNMYAVAYDSKDDLVFFGGQLAVFGYYNRTSDVDVDLRGTDPGDWIGSMSGNSILNLAYDPDNNLIYLVGAYDTFGVYNISSNITEDLRPTDPNHYLNFSGANGLYSVSYDSTNKLVYVGGSNGIFAVYNRTSNTITTLSCSVTCTTYNTCSGGVQTRTCTYSCGQPSYTETIDCSGTGGGLPPNPAITQSFSGITSGQSFVVPITNPSVSVTNITINAKANISSATLTFQQNLANSTVINFKISNSLTGIVYQAFDIVGTNLNSTDMTATIQFRVNKTWITQNGVNPTRLRLYRQPTGSTTWGRLTTTQVGQDANYYYYSAVTPGFSTFVVFFNLDECTTGAVRCLENQVQSCDSDNNWTLTQTCEFGCNNGKCESQISILKKPFFME